MITTSFLLVLAEKKSGRKLIFGVWVESKQKIWPVNFATIFLDTSYQCHWGGRKKIEE
jgi:hypothetical protein